MSTVSLGPTRAQYQKHQCPGAKGRKSTQVKAEFLKQSIDRLRSAIVALVLSAALPVVAFAQSAEDLKNDAVSPGNVLTYGMGYGQQRFSPLTQINRQTVKRLVPAWAYSMANNLGEEAQALVKDGVIYLTDHDKTVAVDALTGKEIWKTIVEYPAGTTRVVCCGIVNRGGALRWQVLPHDTGCSGDRSRQQDR